MAVLWYDASAFPVQSQADILQFTDEIPKSPSGKIQRKVLRDMANAASDPESKL